MSQEAQVVWLLPLTKADSVKSTSAIFEPDELTVLNAVIPEYIAGMIVSCVKESFASEVAARRVAMDSAGIALWATLPVAVVCGFAMMFVLALLMRAVMKLRGSGNADNRNAIGVSGKVYLTVPPSRTASGKVHLMLQGTLVERDAVTDSTEAIPTGSEVLVIGLSGQTDLVVRKK
jgi:hypothetical protein